MNAPQPTTLRSSAIRLVEAATGQTVPAAPNGAVLLSSAELGWRGLIVELHRLPPMEMPEHFVQGHRLITVSESPVEFEWRENGRWRNKVLGPGTFSMQEHGTTNNPRWRKPFTFLALALEPAFLADAFCEALPPERLHLAERRGEPDPIVARFAARFRHELRERTYEGALFGQSLGVAFASHLLEQHGAGRPRVPRGRLSGEQTRAALEILHDRLGEDLSLEELARAAHLSPFHFARLFKTTLGASPHQYLMRLRIERAKRLLAAPSRANLSALGLDLGFSDAAHFANAFRRAVGVPPSTYALQAR